MTQIFESVLSASLSGSVIVLLVLILRLVLRKAPKRYICLLWLLAAVRLLIPFRIESSLSLQPNPKQFLEIQLGELAVQENITPLPALPDVLPDDIVISTTPGENIEITPGDAHPDNPVVNGSVLTPNQPGTATDPVTNVTRHAIDWLTMAAYVWGLGTCGILVYTLISYIVLRRKVADAVQLDKGIYECAAIESPFLLGYFQPRIYLPAGLSLSSIDPILSHEQTHIRRGDNWWKLLGFLCVAVHWFNPLVWLGYAMLCRDIEMACDEQVIRHMDLDSRKAYSNALVSCAAQHRIISACPVAFGEVSVKQRILNVLNYRKPAFWISIIAVIAIVFVAVCFLTDPATDEAVLLEKCRTALEDFQSTRCYHSWSVSEDLSIRWLILDAPEQYEDWNGSSREYLLIADNAQGSLHRLHLGDQYLQRFINHTEDGERTESGWYPSDWSSSDGFTTYTVADLYWDAFSSITVTGSHQERISRSPESDELVDATIVTLRMVLGSRETDRDFYLDEAGKLFRIDSTYLLTNDRETIQNRITQHYTEAAADTQVYLDQCIQALQELKEAEILHLETFSKQISEPTMFWIRTDEGQLASRFEDGILSMTLESGSAHFRRDKTYYGSYLIGDSGWYITQYGITDADYPWFLTMDWDNAGAYVLSRFVNEYNEEIQIMVPGQENPLQFNFDIETGELDCIYLNGVRYTRNRDALAASDLELYYRLATEPAAEPDSPAALKCRKAIETLQTGSYTIVQSETVGKQSYARLQGFKTGDSLLIQRTNTEQSYLRLDGKDYVRDVDGWTETDLGNFSGIADWWLTGLQWDPDRFFVQHDYGDITVAVADDSLPKGFYLLVFSFDQETGKLSSLRRSYDTGTPGDWTTHTSTLTIRYPEPDSIDANIRQYFDSTQK